ncbi:MAG: DegT/DnrJ/EryC1/StrS family aminotransferase [Pirellulales bacterium]|nr:DegT/DnrJ/EryC1/StrS family aminotransferase [Pirellulales bacterium]
MPDSSTPSIELRNEAVNEQQKRRRMTLPAGGEGKLFAEPLHVGRPNLADRERLLSRFSAVLQRQWLSNNGPCVQEFEAAIAERLGVRHCVAVANATLGLQLAVRALGLGGEVIVPSFTFPATVHALAWQGIRPVFVDVDPVTHNIDPEQVALLVGPQTTGILGVHLWGNPCDTQALERIASRHGLALLFDAAHAFGCAHRGRMIGSFGRAEVFSFHATKFLSCGEGGAVTTNDDELANSLRRLRSFGYEGDQVAELGINAKMNELNAAMGLCSLECYDRFVARNAANLTAYRDVLAEARGLCLFAPPTADLRNHQYVVVEVNSQEAGITRDAVLAALHEENVLAKRYFHPGCHRLAPYAALYDRQRTPLPHTEELSQRLLQFPTGMAVTPADIHRIGEFLQHLTSLHKHAA